MSSRDERTPALAPASGPRRLIFEMGAPESRCVEAPALEVPTAPMEEWLDGRTRVTELHLPNVTEPEIVRHYAHLAEMNFGLDTNMYPLGSCTMKHNPRVNEDLSRLEGFAGLHPYQPPETVPGVIELMAGLCEVLAEVSGLPGVTLQPAAGAHGELTALMCIRAALADAGDVRRTVLVPDSAHGTNPATVAMCGYDAATVPSAEDGGVDVEALAGMLGPDVAAIMLTMPNTLGLFDDRILEVTDMVHAAGAYAYMDGANLNALLGRVRPGELGFDALHVNLHKTFSTPHGGGGPGSGPVCVTEALADYLPAPCVARTEEGRAEFFRPARSVGRIRSFNGNVAVLVRAYAYACALGGEGLTEVAEQSVLSANYLKEQLRDSFELPYDRPCMHEFVLSGSRQRREHGVRTLDIAKRLLDYGFHPPTVYFPLIVEEALMIEPTETESLETLDVFASALNAIAREAAEDPDLVKNAPYATPVRRIDEARAAREPDLRWRPGSEGQA